MHLPEGRISMRGPEVAAQGRLTEGCTVRHRLEEGG
jgi:hypothetical protein